MEISRKRSYIAAFGLTCGVLALVASSSPDEFYLRQPRTNPKREHAMDFIDSWTDAMFERQFRVCQEHFNGLLGKIEPLLEKIGSNPQMQAVEVWASPPRLMFLITMRILACAASWIDLVSCSL